MHARRSIRAGILGRRRLRDLCRRAHLRRRAPAKSIEALDQRSARIKAELDEARRLRDEAAQAAGRISAQAARGRARGRRHRRRRQGRGRAGRRRSARQDGRVRCPPHQVAETKIAQAEAQALADVRAAAAEAAVAAAEKILAETVKGKVADDLIAQGIADAAKKLNVN